MKIHVRRVYNAEYAARDVQGLTQPNYAAGVHCAPVRDTFQVWQSKSNCLKSGNTLRTMRPALHFEEKQQSCTIRLIYLLPAASAADFAVLFLLNIDGTEIVVQGLHQLLGAILQFQ